MGHSTSEWSCQRHLQKRPGTHSQLFLSKVPPKKGGWHDQDSVSTGYFPPNHQPSLGRDIRRKGERRKRQKEVDIKTEEIRGSREKRRGREGGRYEGIVKKKERR